MTTRQERDEAARELEGIKTLMAHAAEMNMSGRLDNRDFAELRRYAIGKTVDAMTMEEYVEARKSGDLDRLLEEAGQASGEPERDSRELDTSRVSIAKKVAGDLYGNLWNAGHLKDADYVGNMKAMGLAPERDQHVIRDISDPEPSAEQEAPEIWERASGVEPRNVTRDPNNAYTKFKDTQRQPEPERTPPWLEPPKPVTAAEIAEMNARNAPEAAPEAAATESTEAA